MLAVSDRLDEAYTPRPGLTWRLGEGPEVGDRAGVVGALDALARSGLPVCEGVVLGREAHAEFLRTSGVLRTIASPGLSTGDATYARALARGRSYGSAALGEKLRSAIVEALIGLGARTATVVSDEETRSGLSTIPEVIEAVRAVWLSPAGLARQVTALARDEEIPTWPILIQREPHAEYTGWTTAGDPAALHDVRPVRSGTPEQRGLSELTLEAGSVLLGPVRLLWGLEEGRWQILAVRMTA